MDNNSWSKTILQVYRYLPRVTYVYDNLIKTRAYNSAHISTSNCAFNDILTVSNAILTLSERKITLINLKIITEQVLKSIDEKSARMLILKYIDNKKSTEIAERFNICLRTFFRKLNHAFDSFTKRLNRLGYTSEKLKEMLKEEKWIMEIYNKLNTEHNNIDTSFESIEFNRQIKSSLILEFKKVSSF